MIYMNFADRLDGPSIVDQETKVWKGVHSLPVQSKIKIFLWRTAQNVLPMGSNLLRRDMFDNLACVHCGYHVEDDKLFDCIFARKFCSYLLLGEKWLRISALSAWI